MAYLKDAIVRRGGRTHRYVTTANYGIDAYAQKTGDITLWTEISVSKGMSRISIELKKTDVVGLLNEIADNDPTIIDALLDCAKKCRAKMMEN